MALAREHSVEALGKIIAIMNKPDAEDRTVLHAANLVIERGYGRAPQTIAHDHVHNLTDHELHRQLREAAAELRAIGCGHLLDEPAGTTRRSRTDRAGLRLTSGAGLTCNVGGTAGAECAAALDGPGSI